MHVGQRYVGSVHSCSDRSDLMRTSANNVSSDQTAPRNDRSGHVVLEFASHGFDDTVFDQACYSVRWLLCTETTLCLKGGC